MIKQIMLIACVSALISGCIGFVRESEYDRNMGELTRKLNSERAVRASTAVDYEYKLNDKSHTLTVLTGRYMELQKEKENIQMTAQSTLSGDDNHYFTDWVIDQIDSFIGTADGDLVVKTTLDPRLQLLAEAKQKAMFKRIDPQDKVSQGALLTEAPDGSILAMVGGVDYKTSQFNRVTQAQRQPGSAFKPFVYLAALESGLTPNDLIEDVPIREGSYQPDNYDGKYYGTVSLTQALAKSLNTATIRLLQLVGMDRFLDVASRMGFTEEIRPELASGLGATEVNLLDLTNAYAVIANGGHAVWPYAVLSIKDGHGQLLYQQTEVDSPRVFEEKDISALDGMLAQVIAQGTGEQAQLSHGHAAGKTGTTQSYRDAWFIGYTDKLVTGIWMGNDDNTPMRRVTGGKYPAQLWHDYMSEAVNIVVPKFVPEPSFSGESGFADMLRQWSSGFTGENKISPPVYNK
ncbi:MAG: hypothetical protein HY052_09390 [Proteobacteria bacterium]|nr:hypothetical protein [Pseudomonadota bacterium]